MNAAEAILYSIELWAYAGLIVAVPFLIIGIDRIDEDARGAYIFRPLLIPGVLLVWPLVLWRWVVLELGKDNWRKRYTPPRKTHGVAAIAMALAVCVVLTLAYQARQTWPTGFEPKRISQSTGADQ